MTRIGGSGMNPADGLSFGLETERREFGNRHDHLHGNSMAGKDNSFGRDTLLGQFDLAGGLGDERQELFLEKIKRALGDGLHQEDSQDAADQQLRLVAVAGNLPLPVPSIVPVAPTGDVPVVAPDRVAQVNALVERIERLVDAPVGVPGQPGISLSLNLAGTNDSFSGLVITMSSTTIDLVLTRIDGTAAADDLQAAQMLADRLHARFSRRVVRVLEVDAPAAVASQGLDAISRLLSHPGARS